MNLFDILNFLGVNIKDIFLFIFRPCIKFIKREMNKRKKIRIIYPVYEIKKHPKFNNRLLLTIDETLDSDLIGLAATVYIIDNSSEIRGYVVKIEKPTVEGRTQLTSMVLTQHTINYQLNKEVLKNTIIKLGVEFDNVQKWYDKYISLNSREEKSAANTYETFGI